MIHYAKYDSPLGVYAVGYTDKAITAIDLAPQTDENLPSELSGRAAAQLDEYFCGVRRQFELPLELAGSDFQLRVWHELLRIPYGETRTYGDIARALGNPGACRAVGGANHKNPVCIVVPCHRVVAANGIGGYGPGIEMKKKLLELEKGAVL